MTADNATFPATNLQFDKYGQDGGHFKVTNTTPCGIIIHTLEFAMTSTYPAPPAFQPIGGVYFSGTSNGAIQVHEGLAHTVGTLFNTPTGTVFGTGVFAPANDALRSMTFTDGVGYTIPAYGSEEFDIEIPSFNMPPPGTVNIGLYSVGAMNAYTSAPYTWTATAATASSVTASTLTMVRP